MSFRTVVLFFSATSLAKAINIVTTFLVAKFLDPSDYGIYITLQLINSYSPILCLGTMETLVKQYPFYVGQDSLEKAGKLEQSVYTSIIVSSAVTGLAGIVALSVLYYKIEGILLLAVGLVTLVSVFDFFAMFTYNRSMAHQNFKLTSLFETARSLFTFLFVIPGAYFFGFIGAVAGYACSCFAIQYLSMNRGNKVFGRLKYGWHWKSILEAIKIGLPISIIWWLFGIQQSVDRLVSLSLLGPDLTGYYGLGTRIIHTLGLIPLTAGRVLYPRISEEIGRKSGRENIERLVVEPAAVLGLIIAPIIAMAFVMLPFFYRNFFPEYAQGLVSAQILLISFFFFCQVRNGFNYLIAIDKQNMLAVQVFITLVICLAIQVLLVKLDMSIEGIALGVAISGFYLTVVVWYAVLKHLGATAGRIAMTILELHRPFFFLLVFPLIIAHMINTTLGFESELFLVALLAVLLVAALLLPPQRRELMSLLGRFRK